MATDFDKPVNTTTYSDVWEFVRDNINLVSTWFDEAETTGVNIPTNAKRFSSTNKRPEYWSGAAWLELLSKATTAYDIRAAVADLADLATNATTSASCTGNSATASLATNSLQLGGVLASSYTQDTEIRPVLYGGTGSNSQSGARTNLDVYSKSEGDARYLLESNNLSDLTNDATARTNLSVYSKSETYTATQIDTKLEISYTTSDVTVTSGTGTQSVNAPTGYSFLSIFGTSLYGNTINSTGTTVGLKRITGGDLLVTIVWFGHNT